MENKNIEKAISVYESTKAEERLISGDGRIMLPRPEHFGTRYIGGRYVYEHRYLMELALGRPLGRNELVHHKDHNKNNNHPLNLELMDRHVHNNEHPQKKKEENFKQCIGCGEKYYERKPHSKYPFHSRECYIKNWGRIKKQIRRGSSAGK